MDRQAQSLLLQGHQGRGALLATRNFPVGPPGARMRGHGAPHAVPGASREGLVRRDGVRSLAHIPMWVASGPSGPLRSGTLPGLTVPPGPTAADGLTVMRVWALRGTSPGEGCREVLPHPDDVAGCLQVLFLY